MPDPEIAFDSFLDEASFEPDDALRLKTFNSFEHSLERIQKISGLGLAAPEERDVLQVQVVFDPPSKPGL